jgi:thymidylate synthase
MNPNYLMTPYDNALIDILKNGEVRENRTGVNTRALFGYQMRFDISERFPILTKRKMFPRSVFAELLWILSGSTNVNDLEARGSKIWSAWRDKEFEEKNRYQDGDFGPIYGYQLRHFGGDYKDSFATIPTFYEGFDQLKYVVNELKNNKTSRRILFSYWDPSVVTTNKVRLPPCHLLAQFNVDNKDRLSGLMYQRSCDTGCGAPANIQFYSVLIIMLAQQCGYEPYEFVYQIGDIHLYENQISAVEEYLSRDPIDSPKLIINKAKDIDSYKLEDFNLINYNPAPAIKMPVAV